jgi:protein-S-isoprenylcysteine O-methyltransferase Ste14
MSIRTPSATPASLFAWTGALAFAGSIGWFLYCYLVPYGVPAAPGPVARPILIDTALFGAFALHHSLLARTGLKQRIRRTMRPELERSLYTWTASILFIVVCSLWQPVPGIWYGLDAPWSILGYSVQAIGIALTLGSARAVDFLDLAGVRQVQHAARGTTPQRIALQTRGLYGCVRHPLYLAWVLMVFGAPAMTATRATFAIISTAYIAIAIQWEERSLVETFGREYENYRRRVRWRMVPWVY